MTSEPSGKLYSVVTKHWPRIAAGLVVVIGLVEFVVGGLTADAGLELYVFAWAATTGGLWFLFEKAEKALSEQSREIVVDRIRGADFTTSFESIPAQFALLFDRVFGEKHLSWRCFFRSAIASTAATFIVYSASVSLSPFLITEYLRVEGVSVGILSLTTVGLAAAVGAIWQNVLSDYLSLLETRWAIRWVDRGRSVPFVLVADLLMTFSIFLAYQVFFVTVVGVGVAVANAFTDQGPGFFTGLWQKYSGLWELIPFYLRLAFDTPTPLADAVPSSLPYNTAVGTAALWRIYFYTTFFTSVWLWLYAASVIVSRVLLRMNSGIGFLLRVTDVEKQPFRSMGFVSVIITSVIFALGLPLVLL